MTKTPVCLLHIDSKTIMIITVRSIIIDVCVLEYNYVGVCLRVYSCICVSVYRTVYVRVRACRWHITNPLSLEYAEPPFKCSNFHKYEYNMHTTTDNFNKNN